MRRWLLTALAWTGATLLLLPVCAFAALLLAGPHSDLVPEFLKSPVFIICIAVLLGVPAWIARAV